MDKAEKNARLIEHITKRKQKLEEARKNLKAHFFGIDEIIDSILRMIEGWYVMPDVIRRPVVINLWGLTGVGKTDLVRRLVKEIGFCDKYVEVQLASFAMASDDEYGPSKQESLQEMMTSSDLAPGEPGVILLDEIQRLRSIDREGDEIASKNMQDIWVLLGDGKFPRTENNLKDRLVSMLLEGNNSEFAYFRGGPDENNPFFCSYSHAKFLKRILKFTYKIEQIMKWDLPRLKKEILAKIQDQSVFEGEDYSKLLVFVSGNLDEAFKMANNIADVDVDADIFYHYSKLIDILTIKKALRRRFRPEQISRLGNNHVIYPSLSKASYEGILSRKVAELSDDINAKLGLELGVSKELKDFIYRNGVFPTQGTRPLFSTISTVIESNIPNMALALAERSLSSGVASYDDARKKLVVEADGKIVYDADMAGAIDVIRSTVNKNLRARLVTSVHEGAHALLYAVLFGLVPKQIVSDSVDNDTPGFVRLHDMAMSEGVIRKRISVLLAGLAAEENVFGTVERTAGSSADLKESTKSAAEMLRQFAMGPTISVVSSPYSQCGDECDPFQPNEVNGRLADTDTLLESIIKEQLNVTREVLRTHSGFFKEIVDALVERGKLDTTEFKKICNDNGFDVRIVPDDEIIYHADYEGLYDGWKGGDRNNHREIAQ